MGVQGARPRDEGDPMMNRTARTTAALAGATMLAATLAQPAGAATERQQVDVLSEHVSMTVVLEGAMDGHRGNQHRLTYRTFAEGAVSSRTQMRITSYYCPTGAKVTATWASSRCTYRQTSYLDRDRSDYRVSSTMRSAVVEGDLTAGSRSFAADLTLRATEEPTFSQYGDARMRHAVARASGEVAGATVRQDANAPVSIFRLERD